ncbi:MAG TPA: hypothetical protein VKR61_01710 [Bryobacteraceae bacterium]|nr:hypothetical protein [Bryobacteraceae bacterium]
MQRNVVVLLLWVSAFLPGVSAAEKPSRWRAVWRASQALLAGGEAADAASSWGKNEANPLVRSGQRFSYGSLAIKLGTLTGCLVAQHYIVRHHPENMPAMASANLATAAMFGAVAARNMHVPVAR